MFAKVWTLASIAAAVVGAPVRDFDYVIVGGGTAGVALATRLSQGLPSAKILLLEAGPSAPDELRINIPGKRGSALGSVYDWNFTTVAQSNVKGRSIDVNRGRVLGGSSALNYLCYDRAAEAEYDAWNQLGNDDWDWGVMLRAMTKSENFTGSDGDIHGNAGPIKSTYNRIIPDVLKTWKPTLSKMGVPINEAGGLGGDPIGVMFQPTNIDTTHWIRSYSATSYLPLAGANLEVWTNARVAKVGFSKNTTYGNLRATHVVLEDKTRIRASDEVILSAGSIQSPGLLEASGIGQAKVLKAANITLRLELPGVGENYQDHIRVGNVYRLKTNYSSFDNLIFDGDSAYGKEQLQLWSENQPSWLDYTTTAYSFLNWDQVVNNSNTKNELQKLAKQSQSGDKMGSTAIDQKKVDFMRDSAVPQVELIFENNFVGAKDYPGGKFVTLISTLMHPMSRGSVHIDPAKPLGKPIIDPRYLSHPFDIRALVEAVKYARRVANTEPMRSLWESEFEPGPDVQSDAQWREFATKSLFSFFHPTGTCAMLPKDKGGVVDSSLIVHGTANLRVVDASIIPVLLSGHIQTAVYGIAENAAEMIIRDANS